MAENDGNLTQTSTGGINRPTIRLKPNAPAGDAPVAQPKPTIRLKPNAPQQPASQDDVATISMPKPPTVRAAATSAPKPTIRLKPNTGSIATAGLQGEEKPPTVRVTPAGVVAPSNPTVKLSGDQAKPPTVKVRPQGPTGTQVAAEIPENEKPATVRVVPSEQQKAAPSQPTVKLSNKKPSQPTLKLSNKKASDSSDAEETTDAPAPIPSASMSIAPVEEESGLGVAYALISLAAVAAAAFSVWTVLQSI